MEPSGRVGGQAIPHFGQRVSDNVQFYPPLQKTTGICPWMNAHDGPSEARLAPWSTPHGRDESRRVRTYSTGADFAE